MTATALAPTPTATRPPAGGWARRDTAAMIGRSLRRSLRTPDTLIMGIALPVILMLLFVYVFGGAIQTGQAAYVDYVVPGIVLLCAGYGAATTAVSVASDMTGGLMNRFRTLPVRPVAALTGHVVESVVRNAVSTALVVGVAYLACARSAIIDGAPAAAGSEERAGGLFVTLRLAVREPRTLALGMIIFCAFTIEMSANNWLPLTLVDDFGRTEALAAVLYGTLVVAQTSVRVVGGRVVDALGRVRVLRVSAVLVALGVLLVAFTPAFWGIPLALVLWGAGAALGYPLAISAAADRRTHATARVAAVAAFGTLAGLTMPQAIGLLAERVDLRLALLLLVAVAAGMAALATAARPVADAHPGSEEEGRRADTLEP